MARNDHDTRARVARLLGAVILLAASPLYTGCYNIRPLVFATGTTIGVEATVEEGPSQHLIVGLKRFEGAIVPTVYETTLQGLKVRKAPYSVFAGLGFKTGFLGTGTRIVQVFATGNAAQSLAGVPTGLSNMALATDGKRAKSGEAANAVMSTFSDIHAAIKKFFEGNEEGVEPDPEAGLILAQLNAFAKAPLPNLAPFSCFVWDGTTCKDEGEYRPLEGREPGFDERDSDFDKIMTYRSNLAVSVRQLKSLANAAAAAGKTLDTFDFKYEPRGGGAERDASVEDKKMLTKAMADQIRLIGEFDAAMSKSTAVRNALEYFTDRVTE